MESETFETLTRDSFKALESRQAQLILAQLDSFIDRLDEIDDCLIEYLRKKETVPLR